MFFLDEIILVFKAAFDMDYEQTAILYTIFLLAYREVCVEIDERFAVSVDDFLEFYPEF